MLILPWLAILTIAFSASSAAQEPTDRSAPLRIGPGISPPRIVDKVEPQYSPLAEADHVQGTVVIQIVVDERGVPRNIQVISPLGYGLDERAEEAVAKWRFIPGMKDGKPVRVQAQVQVNFRFPEIWFDAKAEQRRTSFNLAIKSLEGTRAAARDSAIKTIQDLARENFPAAMYLVGLWTVDGENNVAKDTTEGWGLIQKAADKNYGPALYETAIRILRAGGDPAEMEKQRKKLRDAAVLGSIQAQYYLGQAYESGIDVPKEPDRARRYFRLCAIKGVSLCQYRLGQLLLAKDKQERSEDDYAQALAWLELASDHKIAEATTLLDSERPQISAAQASLVKAWKAQLANKPIANP
jgi:TonB family protein